MKQYLMLVDEQGMRAMMAVMPSVQYLEVQGMDVGNTNEVKLLATPVNPPVAPVDRDVVRGPSVPGDYVPEEKPQEPEQGE